MAAVIPFNTRTELSEGEQLGERISELNAYLNVAQAEFLELLREFDEQHYWEDQGFRSCAHWLNFKCGIGFNAARERLRIAHALVKVSKIRAAFAEGTVSFSKVRAMTRIATTENEDLLLNIAHHGTAYHVERFVSQYRRVEKLQQLDHAQELYERRELTYRYDEDGCVVIKARLPAEDGELVIRALERAVALPDVVPSGETSEGRETVSARRADALREVAETYLNNPENAGTTADRYQVVVHVREDGDAHTAHLENGPHVSAETSERIACDCCVSTIDVDAGGEPLNVGRRSRSIPPPMRRALQARDGGCRFPGCTSHRFCDGHHIEHWQNGGETSLDNLVLLCRHHHRLVHEGGFDCRRSDSGEIFFVDRRQQRLAEYESPDPVSIEQSLAWMYRRFDRRRLDSDTCAAKQHAGETMDWDHAMFLAFAPASSGSHFHSKNCSKDRKWT
ncbi:MAG: DUF222 domain-containing protein [Woeseiaceae bacterium]|nr:DUF222 domain-containing protein [Woeseiaceae bacterium]